MVEKSPLISVMTEAVIKASRGLQRDFGELERLQVSRKGTADFVTAADLRCEKVLKDELSRVRPDFGFLMEESGEVVGKDTSMRWIIDPVDGTNNLIHGVPYFCISVGLEKRLPGKDPEILAAIIYDPIRGELFAAEKGQGAFITNEAAYISNQRLRVSGRKNLEEALFATSMPRKQYGHYETQLALLETMSSTDASIRTGGASALDLAYVAAGRYDGCWFNAVHPWDMAAGILLIQEAGGYVTSLGKDRKSPLDTGSILAANSDMHAVLTKLLT